MNEVDELKNIVLSHFGSGEEQILDLSTEQSTALLIIINDVLSFEADNIAKYKRAIKRSISKTYSSRISFAEVTAFAPLAKSLFTAAVISALLLSGCAAENDVSQTADSGVYSVDGAYFESLSLDTNSNGSVLNSVDSTNEYAKRIAKELNLPTLHREDGSKVWWRIPF